MAQFMEPSRHLLQPIVRTRTPLSVVLDQTQAPRIHYAAAGAIRSEPYSSALSGRGQALAEEVEVEEIPCLSITGCFTVRER